MVAFNHHFQKLVCVFRPLWPTSFPGSLSSSVTSLCTCVWKWSLNLFEHNAFCLKPDETGFMFDCCMQCLIIIFDCLSVWFPNVRLCSIGNIVGWVQLSSITEPNRSHSNDCSSLGFDWLRRALNMAGYVLKTRYNINFVRWFVNQQINVEWETSFNLLKWVMLTENPVSKWAR